MADKCAVLFDVDGTLVDSNYFHTVAWWRAFQEDGHTTPMWRLHRLIGMGGDQLTKQVLGEERSDLEDRWIEQFDRLKDQVSALPGAKDLIEAVAGHGATVFLATSGAPEFVEHLRGVIGADEWVDGAVNSSEVEASKPAPDIFRLALDRAGVTPERAMVVGDTVWDVQAATACGVRCVAFLTGGVSRAELLEAGAAGVYEDASDLLVQLDASPLGALLNAG